VVNLACEFATQNLGQRLRQRVPVTFVPGLPLTVLDHTLVQGNALIGIGTIDEIRNWFERHSTKMFPVDADNLLKREQVAKRSFEVHPIVDPGGANA
jgi:hypothetical protein